jgi:hypothetical protein
MISYEDGVAALTWLHKAFGFVETARLITPDGRLSHGEMKAGDGLITLASPTHFAAHHHDTGGRDHITRGCLRRRVPLKGMGGHGWLPNIGLLPTVVGASAPTRCNENPR